MIPIIQKRSTIHDPQCAIMLRSNIHLSIVTQPSNHFSSPAYLPYELESTHSMTARLRMCLPPPHFLVHRLHDPASITQISAAGSRK